MLSEYIYKVASDPDTAVHLGGFYGLYDILRIIDKFNFDKVNISELSQVVKKKRQASQQGPNKIMYRIQVRRRVEADKFRIMLVAVRSKVIPLKWPVTDGIMISKVQNPRQSISADNRQMALENVKGKLFWSLKAQRFY